MITVNKHLTAPVSALALGLALAALASPSFAQRSEQPMSTAREQAFANATPRPANTITRPGKPHRSTRTDLAWLNTANRNSTRRDCRVGRRKWNLFRVDLRRRAVRGSGVPSPYEVFNILPKGERS